MRANQIVLLLAGNMSGNLISEVLPMKQNWGVSIEAVFTTSGTLAGTLSLEGSVNYETDNNGNVINAGNWVPIANSTEVISGAGAYVWDITTTTLPFIRAIYTKANGDTGVLKITACPKGI